jgi:hypothetical protein
MEKNMRSKVIVAVLGATALAASLAAQTKPDFSGSWKLNIGKSDYGVLPPSNSRTDVIEHKDPSLKVNVSDDGAQGQQNYTLVLTTDGKEATNHPGGLDMKNVATWQGSNLVVTTKLQFQGNDVSIKSTWSLSEDGKTLTESAHLESPMGETDQKFIFEKQDAGATAVTASASTPSSTAASAKTDYSGTWKLNVAKSDFGPIPGPDSRTDIIDHKDPMLKVNTSQEGGQQGKQEFTLSLTTDGKEAVNTPGGLELKSTAGWDTKNLVVNTKLKFQDNDVAIKTTWLLSEDGKTLTQNAHLSTPMGELDQKMVFEKQCGAAACE